MFISYSCPSRQIRSNSREDKLVLDWIQYLALNEGVAKECQRHSLTLARMQPTKQWHYIKDLSHTSTQFNFLVLVSLHIHWLA